MYFFNTVYQKILCDRKKQKKVIYSQYNSLQAQGCHYNISNFINKSTFLSALYSNIRRCSQGVNGSFSLEATLVLPIFIITFFVFIYVMISINFTNVVQRNEFMISKELSQDTYILQKIEENGNITPDDINMSSSLLKEGLSLGYIKTKICNDELITYAKTVKRDTYFNMENSKISSNNEYIDIRLTYDMKIPYIDHLETKLILSNRSYFRTWVGKSINQNNTNCKTKVYITPTGSVYHVDKNCPYIKLSIMSVNFKSILSLRNKSGEKYDKCEICCKKNISSIDQVFITIYGNKYHIDKNCSGIKRDIQEIDLSEVGNRSKCKKCGNN